MKKLISYTLLFLLAFTFSPTAMAQQPLPDQKDLEAKPVIVRDRLMFDFFHTFWMGVPSKVNVKKFHPGFNFSAMWDFLLPNKGPLSFGLGVGVCYYTQFSDAVLSTESDSITRFAVISDNISYKVNKFNYTNIHIPFEIRYRHQCGFKISVGARLGLITGITYRYKGSNPNGNGEFLNYRDYNVLNQSKVNFDVYLRTGWKAFGVYFSYQVTSLFKEKEGPQMHPMALGLTINFF